MRDWRWSCRMWTWPVGVNMSPGVVIPEAAEASGIQFAQALLPPLDLTPAHELGRVADLIPISRRKKLRLGDNSYRVTTHLKQP